MSVMASGSIYRKKEKNKQKAHGQRFGHLIKTAIACLQIPHNFFQMPQQLGHKFDHTVKAVKFGVDRTKL